MPGPGGVLVALAGAIAGGLAYVRLRALRRSGAEALQLLERSLPGSERMLDRDGAPALRARFRDVHVVFRAGAPSIEEPAWPAGFGASARYVTGGGPAFRTDDADPRPFLRTESAAMPLRRLYGRTIPILGDHVDARPLVDRALLGIEPTGTLTAPHLRSDGAEVAAWLARTPRPADVPAVGRRLGDLVAALARWRDDVLAGYAAATGAHVSVDPHGSPPLTARVLLGHGVAPIVIEARYLREATSLVGPHSFAVRATGPARLALPRERVPLGRVHPDALRRLPPALLSQAPRAHVRGEGDQVIVEWAMPPTASEMVAAIEVLRRLSPATPTSGPFR